MAAPREVSAARRDRAWRGLAIRWTSPSETSASTTGCTLWHRTRTTPEPAAPVGVPPGALRKWSASDPGWQALPVLDGVGCAAYGAFDAYLDDFPDRGHRGRAGRPGRSA